MLKTSINHTADSKRKKIGYLSGLLVYESHIVSLGCRKMRLIESDAKCRHPKNVT